MSFRHLPLIDRALQKCLHTAHVRLSQESGGPIPWTPAPVPSPQREDSAHEYLSRKYLQGLLKGRVHRVLLHSGLAFALGGSVRQQIGLHVPGGDGRGARSGADAVGGGEPRPSVVLACSLLSCALIERA